MPAPESCSAGDRPPPWPAARFPRSRWGAVGLGAILLGALAAYYAASWASLDEYFGALDHCPFAFCDFQLVFRPQARTLLRTGEPVFGFYYTAFFAVLLGPFASMAAQPGVWAWGVLQGVAAALLCLVPTARALRLSRLGAVLYVVVFASSLPVLHNFKWGQVSVLMTLSIVASLWAYREGRPILAALLLAFGAATKFYPLLFLVCFVVRRDARFLVAFALFSVALFVLVPASAMGIEPWWRFQAEILARTWSADWMASDQNSQFLPHVVQRFAARHDLEIGASAVGLLAKASALVALGHVGLVGWMRRRRVAGDLELAAVLLFLSLPLVIETSWPHYFVHLPLCQALLASRAADTAPAGRTPVLAYALVLASIALSSVFFFNAFSHWMQYSRRGFLLLADVLLFPVAYAVIFRAARRGGLRGPVPASAPPRRPGAGSADASPSEATVSARPSDRRPRNARSARFLRWRAAEAAPERRRGR